MKPRRHVYRLTLNHAAVKALSSAPKKPFSFVPIANRGDGLVDVGVTMSIADQLMTHAKPGENLSDTVLRILEPAS